jgi:hypothetical protein
VRIQARLWLAFGIILAMTAAIEHGIAQVIGTVTERHQMTQRNAALVEESASAALSH